MGAKYFRAKGGTDGSATEQWDGTVNPGTILFQTDTIIRRTDIPSHSVGDLVSALTADLDEEVTAIDVYVSTQATASRLFEATYRTESFRETTVRLHVETAGTYTRYIPTTTEEATPSRSVYTAALKRFIDDCLDGMDEQTGSTTCDDLYEQFSQWYRNFTGSIGPSRTEFGKLIDAEGLERPPRGAPVDGDTHEVNPED